VSALFEKYNGVAGFTTVNITGDMLKLIAQAEAERRDTTFTSTLSEIRILAIEKSSDKPSGINLRSELYDKLDKSVYKEMVSVKKEGEDVVILMKEHQGRIAEILILAGGNDENALIQVKGNMLLSEMADMAGKYHMKGFEHLKKLEK
ncbi:MAG: DUF4252 domain-containing protein, partial [Bacteroidales bacterium]|nr:DUF4252 domain-containing protein [Bacteroidales bacterium]